VSVPPLIVLNVGRRVLPILISLRFVLGEKNGVRVACSVPLQPRYPYHPWWGGALSVEDAEAFISSFRVSYARYEESPARVGRSPVLPSAPSSSICAFAYHGDDLITVPWYYDKAASVSLVSSLTFFAPDSIVEIAPLPVRGVSAGVIVTHSGRLPW